MDGMSTALAVISLTIQLVGTVQNISKFLHDVNHAPTELARLVESLDQLNSTLNQTRHLVEQQFLVLRLPGSLAYISNALKNCERKVEALNDFVKKVAKSISHQHRLQRMWSFSRTQMKDEASVLQNQLRDATISLQCATMNNSWHLHYVISRSI